MKKLEDLIHSMDPGKVYGIGIKSGKLIIMRKVIKVIISFQKKPNKYSQDTLNLLNEILTELNKINIDE